MLNVRPISPTLDRVFTLNREFDRVLNQAFSGGQTLPLWVPATDVFEKNDAYVISLELPGVLPEHVELSFEKNTLTIRGTNASGLPNTENGELRVYAAERLSGSFERTIRLPEYVDSEHIEATFAHGVLTITVPKSQAATPRKIAIRSAEETTPQVRG